MLKNLYSHHTKCKANLMLEEKWKRNNNQIIRSLRKKKEKKYLLASCNCSNVNAFQKGRFLFYSYFFFLRIIHIILSLYILSVLRNTILFELSVLILLGVSICEFSINHLSVHKHFLLLSTLVNLFNFLKFLFHFIFLNFYLIFYFFFQQLIS